MMTRSLRVFPIFGLCLLALSLMVPVPSAWAAGTEKMTVCTQPYALCTSAPCIPMPGDPTKAICACAVEEGVSVGTKPCAELAPSTDANGVRTVYSTYSPKQYTQGKKIMTCPAGTPWTLCLNKVCTVDPADPKKAICTCEVKRDTPEWVTLGGDCDTATCKNKFWSGASVAMDKGVNAALMTALKVDKLPKAACPAP